MSRRWLSASKIHQNGIEALQFEIARKQVDALSAMARGEGRHTIILPSDAVDVFKRAFSLLPGVAK